MTFWYQNSPLSDTDLRTYDSVLRNVQANILSGFSRDAARYGIVRLKPDSATAARAAFGSLARLLTRASDELKLPKPGTTVAHPPALSIGFSSSGFAKIGAQSPIARSFPALLREVTTAPLDWEPPFSVATPVDAVILIAAPMPTGTVGLEATVTRALAPCVSGQIEWMSAFIKRDSGNNAIENFGFRDGISQPVFLESRIKTPKDSAPPKLVLTPDPGKNPEDNEFGSYLVFLKIEQHIDAFNSAATTLATHRFKTGPPSAEQVAQTGAWLIGRNKNGIPLVPLDDKSDLNAFTYNPSDPEGKCCPFAAHIRKMNPRDGDGLRIARRGLAYQEGGKQGIFFQCYQSSIEAKFEVLFKKWGNEDNDPAHPVGADPLLVQPKPKLAMAGQVWPGVAERLDLGPLVTIRGGEYFYMPSIAYFERMAPATTPAPPPPPAVNPPVSS